MKIGLLENCLFPFCVTPPAKRGVVLLCLLSSLAVSSTSLQAQQSIGTAVSLNSNGKSDPFGGQHGVVLGQKHDMIFGQNVRGPYRLSWKKIRPYSEQVRIAGQLMARDLDYTIDEDAGVLQFAYPISAKDFLEVTYGVDIVGAEQNKGVASSPFIWKLLQNSQSNLTLLVRPGTTDGSEAQAASYLQYTQGLRWNKNSQLNTGIFLDMRGGDWLDRGGVKVANSTQGKNSEVGFSYSRAGALFTQGDLTGLAAGREVMEFGGTFNPTKHLKIASTYRYTTELLSPQKGGGKGVVTRETENSLTQNLPQNNGTVSTGRTETVTSTPDGNSTTTVNDSAKVSGNLSQRFQANVGFESQTVLVKGSDDKQYAQTTSVGFLSKMLSDFTVSGDYRNQISSSGIADITALKMEGTPLKNWKGLGLHFALENQSRTTGSTLKQNVMLDIMPTKYATINGGIRYSTAPTGEKRIGVLGGTLRSGTLLELSGVTLWREYLTGSTIDPSFKDGYQVNLALKPHKNVNLIGSLGYNPDGNDLFSMRSLEARKMGIETNIGFLTFKGLLGTEDEYTTKHLSNTTDLSIVMRLTKWDLINAGIQDKRALDGGLSASRTYLLSYSRNLNSLWRMTLKSSATYYEQNGSPLIDKTEYRAEAQLGIRF